MRILAIRSHTHTQLDMLHLMVDRLVDCLSASFFFVDKKTLPQMGATANSEAKTKSFQRIFISNKGIHHGHITHVRIFIHPMAVAEMMCAFVMERVRLQLKCLLNSRCSVGS